MKRALLIAVLSLLATAARSDGLGGSWGFGQGDFGGVGGLFAKQAPQPTGDILLVDGVSFILQTDGASLICRAGGC